jgi:hypothetical protein
MDFLSTGGDALNESNCVRLILHWLAFFLVCSGWCANGACQDDSLRSLSSLHSQRLSGRTTEQPNSAGGASLADYTELMNLIESVIDAPWQSTGGTATMAPFRNGVRIDAQGTIERLDHTSRPEKLLLRVELEPENPSNPAIRLDDLGAWQQPTPLRWISLHQLDAQLASCRENKNAANIAMELLGGLCRIDYVAFDASCGEWLLGGPAGNIAANLNGDLVHSDLRLPPILLEDLLTIAPHVLRGKGELGCSIDPVPERLTAAYKMAQSPVSRRDLRTDPEHWAQEWKTKLGRQRTVVVGIPEDSPTGYALLIADAHMKRIALGLEPAVDGLRNYWLEADFISQDHRGPMVRWWFTMSESRIPWDPERKIAHLAESNVRVLSQSQMFDSDGDRVASNNSDWAADAFAKGFTSKFLSLQRSYPIYGRLRHIFDLAVAMEIVRTQLQSGVGKPFQCLHEFDIQPHLPIAPREIDSVVSTRRSSDGSVSAIISGGVSIAPHSTSDRIRRTSKAFDKLILEVSPGERESGSTQGHSPDDAIIDLPFWR